MSSTRSCLRVSALRPWAKDVVTLVLKGLCRLQELCLNILQEAAAVYGIVWGFQRQADKIGALRKLCHWPAKPQLHAECHSCLHCACYTYNPELIVVKMSTWGNFPTSNIALMAFMDSHALRIFNWHTCKKHLTLPQTAASKVLKRQYSWEFRRVWYGQEFSGPSGRRLSPNSKEGCWSIAVMARTILGYDATGKLIDEYKMRLRDQGAKRQKNVLSSSYLSPPIF